MERKSSLVEASSDLRPCAKIKMDSSNQGSLMVKDEELTLSSNTYLESIADMYRWSNTCEEELDNKMGVKKILETDLYTAKMQGLLRL